MEKVDSNSTALKEKIQKVYRHWGIEDRFWENNETTKPQDFIEILRQIESRIPEMNCRVMPSSFDSDDLSLCAYPYYLKSRWDSCEEMLRVFEARGVMMRLPLFWQVESSLHSACRSVGAFIFLNDIANMPVGALAINEAEINVVVTTIEDSFGFSLYLLEKNSKVKPSWIIIHPLDKEFRKVPETLMGKEMKVAQEIDIFPGVTVFQQCNFLWKEKTSLFHLSKDYIIEYINDTSTVTSVGDEPLPLFRYELPMIVVEKGLCECGNMIFEIKNA